MMKLKNIELNGTYKVVYFDASFVIYDEKGATYYENSDGDWTKWEYDEKGKQIYYENSDGDWAKWEYDEKGKLILDGEIFDERVKELTIKQIEKLLGYKIKVKGE